MVEVSGFCLESRWRRQEITVCAEGDYFGLEMK
jgi:hypothetical protein